MIQKNAAARVFILSSISDFVNVNEKTTVSANFFTSFTMASKSRRCLNDPNRFCYICGEYTYCKRIQKIKFK
jgi:hypothetical protein